MALSGRREAWDSPLYWSVAYPLCVALAALLAYVAPERPGRWAFTVLVQPARWALTVMLVQPVVMVFTSGGDFGLLPLGLILFSVLAVPVWLGAVAGASLRRAVARRTAGD
jgi:uncharacterized membrane protein YeiB